MNMEPLEEADGTLELLKGLRRLNASAPAFRIAARFSGDRNLAWNHEPTVRLPTR